MKSEDEPVLIPSIFEIIDREPVINLTVLEEILCECGHSVMCHYFGEGCCDRSRCWCKKFQQVKEAKENE